MSDYCFKTLQSKLKQYHSPYINNRTSFQKEKFKKRLPLSLSHQNLNFSTQNKQNNEKEKNSYQALNFKRNINAQRSNPSLLDNQQSSFFDKTIKNINQSRSNSEKDRYDFNKDKNQSRKKSRQAEKLQSIKDKTINERIRKFSIDQNFQQQFDPFQKRTRIQSRFTQNQQPDIPVERHQSFQDFVQNYQGYRSANYSMRNPEYNSHYNYDSFAQSPMHQDDHIKVYLQERLQLAEKELRILQHQNCETINLLKRRNFEIDNLYNENQMLKDEINNPNFHHERKPTLSNKPILNKKFESQTNNQIAQKIKETMNQQKLTSSENKLMNYIIEQFKNGQVVDSNISMSDIPSDQESKHNEYDVANEISKLVEQTKDRNMKRQLKSLRLKVHSLKKVPSQMEQQANQKFQEMLKQICIDLDINKDFEEFNKNANEQNLAMLEEIKSKIIESKIPSVKSFRQNNKANLIGSFRRHLKKFDDESINSSKKEDSLIKKDRGIVIQGQSNELEKLKQTIDMLKNEKESMKNVIQELKKEKQQNKQDKDKQKEIDNLKVELQNLNNTLKDKTKLISLLEDEKMQNQKTIKELNNKLEEVQKQSLAQEQKLKEMNEELKKSKENKEVLLNQYQELENLLLEREEQQNNIKKQKEQIYQYKQSLEQNEKQMNDLKNRLSQTQSENQNLRSIAERQINKEFLQVSQPNHPGDDHLELLDLSHHSNDKQNEELSDSENSKNQYDKQQQILKCQTEFDDHDDNQSRMFQSLNFEDQKTNLFFDEDGEHIDLEKVESIIQNIIQENKEIQDELKQRVEELEQTVEQQKEQIKTYQIQEQKIKIQNLIKDQGSQSKKELVQKIDKLQKKNDKIIKEKKELKMRVQNLEKEIEEYREICEDLSRHKQSRQGRKPNLEDIQDLQQRILQKDQIIKSFADENMIGEEIQNLQEQVDLLKEQFQIKESEQETLQKEYQKVFQNFKLLKSELLKKEEIIQKLQQEQDQVLDESDELLSDEDNDLFSEDDDDDEDDEEIEIEVNSSVHKKTQGQQ